LRQVSTTQEAFKIFIDQELHILLSKGYLTDLAEYCNIAENRDPQRSSLVRISPQTSDKFVNYEVISTKNKKKNGPAELRSRDLRFRRPKLFSSSANSTFNIFSFLLNLHLIHLACGFVNSLEPDKKAISVLLKIREVTEKSMPIQAISIRAKKH
jgi:hypothetical protein